MPGFYLGKEFDPATGALGARVELDPADLLTHGLIVGMTGSGKTGLAVALIEEALRQGVPVLAIDPKGDLGNLLLLFEGLEAASFAPWVDAPPGAGRAAAGEQAAAAWRKGLADWGLGLPDVAALRQAHDPAIYTPGSGAGIPLNLLGALEAPGVPFDSAAEDLRDEIAGLTAGLLALLHVEADPLRSREAVFLSTLVERAWRDGRTLSLEELVGAVSDPPFEKLGALPLESAFPRKDRQALMLALNNLLASPSFEAWRRGEPLDVDSLLRAPDGRPRLSIVSIAHLADAERLFVTALVLDKVKTWMRRQGGTSRLRALVYMDEIHGFFPPHPANPPSKRPLLTLLKQARSQGVGVVLATQNPVDLDYKGLANTGLWLVGKLQTAQDRDRLREGLLGAGMEPQALERALDATRKRVFLLHDVHRPAPLLLHSRWVMSYLRGPLTRDEIGRLMSERRGAPAAPPSARAGAPAMPPALPAPFAHHYYRLHGGELAQPCLFVKYAARYKGLAEKVAVRAWALEERPLTELLETAPLVLEESGIAREAPPGVRLAPLPPAFDAGSARAVERVLKDRLADKLTARAWYDPVTERLSDPGEDAAAFAARLLAAGPGPKEAKRRERLQKARRNLETAEQSLSGRRAEKWTAIGTAVLSNLGLFRGRKRTISGAGSVVTKNRMENAAEARVAALRAEVAGLESELAAQASAGAERFEPRMVEPVRSDVSILRYDLVWVY
ncbi:MAG TPA: helicase HerA-like domain-containing protein [Vicinamibacteria bacterium]|nr:helicase HerA-like domain-containing protein [Vicinamibacteria bacterium]